MRAITFNFGSECLHTSEEGGNICNSSDILFIALTAGQTDLPKQINLSMSGDLAEWCRLDLGYIQG